MKKMKNMMSAAWLPQRAAQSLLMAVVVCGAVGSLGGRASANLIGNGSFETPALGGSYQTLPAVDLTTLAPWRIVQPTPPDPQSGVDLINTYWQAAEGNQSLDMNGLGRGSLEQDFIVPTAGTYQLSFAISGNPDAGGGLKTLQYELGGAPQFATYDTTVMQNTVGDMKWQTVNYFVNLSAGLNTLSFQSDTFSPLNAGSPAFGPALDNVSVEAAPVPEPSTYAMMGLLMAGVVFAGRRKKQQGAMPMTMA